MSSKSIYGCSAIKSPIDGRYHYVYRITNLVENKHYYGSRTTSRDPFLDLGTHYFSSIKAKEHKWIIEDQKQNSSNYRYKIIGCYTTREQALEVEIRLHNKFDVGRNPKFYNASKQSSSGFDTTGKVVVKDSNGDSFSVSIDDPRYQSGELVHMSSGKITVKDSNGNTFSVSSDDPRILSGELNGVSKGLGVFKDSDGNTFSVPIDDPRVLSGELVGATKGIINVEDSNGNHFRVSINDPRFLSGELTRRKSRRKIDRSQT